MEKFRLESREPFQYVVGGEDETLDILTIEDVSALLKVPKSTVYRYARLYHGLPSFKVGKHIRFERKQVLAWVQHQRR